MEFCLKPESPLGRLRLSYRGGGLRRFFEAKNIVFNSIPARKPNCWLSFRQNGILPEAGIPSRQASPVLPGRRSQTVFRSEKHRLQLDSSTKAKLLAFFQAKWNFA